PTSHRYADGAVAELEKLARQGQYVRDADNVAVAREMISHTEETQMNMEDARNAQLNQAAKFQLQNITSKNVDAMKQKLAQDWKDKQARDA
ncbi:hypothetical protein, partial [Klebsiella pneumoniae]|uniref:hypothetical protein n=1 Tax=Klebsiella pneumoniae TaxID=573 RepID=UPI003B9828F9